MSIQQYELIHTFDGGKMAVLSDGSGQYVLFTDHLADKAAAVAAKDAEIVEAVLWAITAAGVGAPEDHHLLLDIQEYLGCTHERAKAILAAIQTKYPRAIVTTNQP